MYHKCLQVSIPSNGVRLMCGVRLMVTKTNHFNIMINIPTEMINIVHTHQACLLNNPSVDSKKSSQDST